MFKKLFALCALLALCGTCFTGCKLNVEPSPTPTVPPGISKPEGRVVSMEPPTIEGRITKLTENKVWVMVQGVEWELVLNERAQFTIKKLAEYGTIIEKDSFVIVVYDIGEDGTRTANRIELLHVN